MPPLGYIRTTRVQRTEGPLIYMMTFPNGKKYVGQTVGTFEARMMGHKSSSTATKTKGCRLVKSAIRKYGWDNIIKEVVLLCNTEELDMYENKFITAYNTLHPHGYNLITGGNSNKKASDNTKILMARKARERDVSAYRKSEESKNFPKFLHKVDTQYMKGYRITKHPKCSCKHFCNPTNTWEDNFQEAIEFLEKLNSGEEEVKHPPRQLPIGMQVSGNGFRVFWKPENVRHIKNFNTGPYTVEQQFERAKKYLMSIQKGYIIRDVKILRGKLESLTSSLLHQKEQMDTLEHELDNLRKMFND